ncbi:MAG: Glutamate 5-kinase [Candidatus Omnitrophica bacterium]|nr:Glutamate 5-kinase [Candidatus Omnitrophota bacterium]
MVIKVGTSVLAQDGLFDRAAVDALARQITPFLKKGIHVCVVSSGAIGAGMTLLKLRKRPDQMEQLQGAAAVGQRYLMQCYEEAFSRKGYSTAQVLLTWDDLASPKRFLNAKRTLRQIHRWGVVPIVNENDTVATDEIRFGDNDRLSSLLAILMEADVLVVLSNTDGLYLDGKRGSEAHRIKMVTGFDGSVFKHVQDKKTEVTVGGMKAKLRSVRMCVESGIPVFIADGRRPGVLKELFEGRDVGTFFMPERKGRKGGAWLHDLVRHLGAERERADS